MISGDMVYPIESEEWTDEQRMEWQANNLAPRILMPIETFKIKVDQLYQQYSYEDTPLKCDGVVYAAAVTLPVGIGVDQYCASGHFFFLL